MTGTPTSSKSRIYHVALSYAGEQRDYVEQVAKGLASRGISYYYDRDDPTMLWGKHLAEELTRIYERDSASVVIFASADYARKDWTRLERRAALSRAVTERQEYVFVARFDATELEGIPKDVAYIDIQGIAAESFVEMIYTMLTRLGVLPAP
jgi:hypothetical protein